MFKTAFADRIAVSGLSVEFLSKGSGQSLLFLHPGHGVEPDEAHIDLLAERFTVHVPVHPGFGASDISPDMSSVDDLAYYYIDLIEQLDMEDIVLVGVSFGAWIAAELATMGTRRFSHVVLAGALGAKLNGREEAAACDLPLAVVNDLPGLLFKDPAFGRRALHDLAFADLDEAAVERFARNREALLLYGWSPTMYNPKLRGRLARIKVPTLVLGGDGDRVTAPEQARAFAQAIPGARFRQIADAGHYAHIEQPAAFAGAIMDFVGGDARSATGKE